MEMARKWNAEKGNSPDFAFQNSEHSQGRRLMRDWPAQENIQQDTNKHIYMQNKQYIDINYQIDKNSWGVEEKHQQTKCFQHNNM